MSKIINATIDGKNVLVQYENTVKKYDLNNVPKTVLNYMNENTVNNNCTAIIQVNNDTINSIGIRLTAINGIKCYAVTINGKLHKSIISAINNTAINRINEAYTSKIKTITNKAKTDNSFIEIKTDFYNWFNAYNQLNNDTNYVDIPDYNHKVFERDSKNEIVKVNCNFLHVYKSLKNIKLVKDNYCKSIDNLCMILVLSVLKKLSSVTTTTRNAKTKRDSNYYTMRKLKNDLIASHNAFNNLIAYSNDLNKLNTIDTMTLFKNVCSIDGMDLLSVAKTSLLEYIKKAIDGKIKVDLNKFDFLDTMFTYIDINKRVWTDISDNTYIKDVCINNDSTYTVYYTSGKTKNFTSYNDLPKTVIQYINYKNRLNNNISCKEKNIYLVEKTTCIATQIFNDIRYYIQSEKNVSLNNSYCYIDDITSITDSNGKTYEFNTLHRLKHYDKSLIYTFDGKNLNSKQGDIDSINTILNGLKFSDKYKNILNEALKGYKYPTIAKKLNYSVNTCKSSLREIKKKIISCNLISYKTKYNSLKCAMYECKTVIQDVNKFIQDNKPVKKLYTQIINHYEAIKRLKLVKSKTNKVYKLKYITRNNTKLYNPYKVLPVNYTTLYSYKKDKSNKKNYVKFIELYRYNLERKYTAIKNLKNAKTDLYDTCKKAIDDNNKKIIVNNDIINSNTDISDIKNVGINKDNTYTVYYTDNTSEAYNTKKELPKKAIQFINVDTAKKSNFIMKRDNNVYRKTLLSIYNFKVNSCITHTFNTDTNTVYTIAQNKFNIKDTAIRDNTNYIHKFNSDIVDSLVIPVQHNSNTKNDILNYRISDTAIKTVNNDYTVNHSNTANINNICVSFTSHNTNYYNSVTQFIAFNINNVNSVIEYTEHIKPYTLTKTTVIQNTNYNTTCNTDNSINHLYSFTDTFIYIINGKSYTNIGTASQLHSFIYTAKITTDYVYKTIVKPVYYTITQTIKTTQLYYTDINGIRKKHKTPVHSTIDILLDTDKIEKHGTYSKCKPVNKVTIVNTLTQLNKSFFDTIK